MNQADRDRLNRAKEVAHHVLLSAESAIDAAFGALYSRRNPQLVRTMVDLIHLEYTNSACKIENCSVCELQKRSDAGLLSFCKRCNQIKDKTQMETPLLCTSCFNE